MVESILEQAMNSVGVPPAAEAYCRALAQEVEILVERRERERCASLIEARAAELEPLEGKPDIVVWKHGFLIGLASRIRTEV